MNADTLRPFSPAHKHLFGVKGERSRGQKMEGDEGGGRGKVARGCALTIKTTHF